MQHSHHYIDTPRVAAESWDGLQWDVTTKVPTCACGDVQPTRTGLPRPPTVARSRPGKQPPPETEAAQLVAKELLGRASTRYLTLRKAMPATVTEQELAHACTALAACGAIALTVKWDTGWKPWAIESVEQDALEDVAHPGRRQSWQEACKQALHSLPDSPVGARLRDALRQRPMGWDAETLRIATALVHHAHQAKTTLPRVFSATLGDSKLLHRHRGRLEAVLGDLEDLGVRQADDLLLVAGTGVLKWDDGTIHLVPGSGVIGLERRRLRQLTAIRASNVLFIENKTPFMAAAIGSTASPDGLVVYMGGNFGITVEHMLRVVTGTPWIWADLDPFGAGFVRRGHALRSDVRAFRMEVDELLGEGAIPLPAKYREELQRQLARGGPLADLLQAMATHGRVREQESQVVPY